MNVQVEIRRELVSFSTTFRAYAMAEVEISETDKFAFGCARHYLFRDDELIPYEVCWVTEFESELKEAQTKYGKTSPSTGWKPEHLPPVLLKKWYAFLAILKEADSRGDILWEIGDYYHYLVKNPSAVQIGHSVTI